MKFVKNYALLLVVILATVALPVLYRQFSGCIFLEAYSQEINRHLAYQLTTLSITFMLLTAFYFLRQLVFLNYFKMGSSAAAFQAEPFVGIQPKPGTTWSKAGWEWTIIISLFTAVSVYFQFFSDSLPSSASFIKVLPFVVVFSLINSFVEESISRLGVIVALKEVVNDRSIAIVSGLLFGAVHYFGTPGGWSGVVLAGFLGWFLAKSILETKGIFWAWLIHFLQDVIIMLALFSNQM
jgi:membrane protease YdiL (CAAX protease family)